MLWLIDLLGKNKISLALLLRWYWFYFYRLRLKSYQIFVLGTDGIIFVVDSNDSRPERIEAASKELHKLLQSDELRDAALLILANKQDLPNALSAAALTDKLGLINIRNRMWYIQPCCGTTSDGLYEGLDWLADVLQKTK